MPRAGPSRCSPVSDSAVEIITRISGQRAIKRALCVSCRRLTCAVIRPWRANEIASTNSPHIFLFASFVLHRGATFHRLTAHEFCAKVGAVCSRAACLHPTDCWHLPPEQSSKAARIFIPLRQCLHSELCGFASFFS